MIFFSHALNEQDVNNSLIMIQPTLMSYTFDTPPMPVLLDSVSIKHDVVLLLDTFFHILIFHGELVAQWQNQGYQDKEGYENFKELLEVPVADAQDLLVDRFPVPRYIVCDQGKNQARFLWSKLNPSTTLMSATMYGSTPGAGAGQAIFTDDVSLQVFMEHLKHLVRSFLFCFIVYFFYRDQFVKKDFKMSILIMDDINPTLDEITQFTRCQDGGNDHVVSLSVISEVL